VNDRALFRWGDALRDEVELGPGDCLYVGAEVPHEELTPDDSRADMIVVLNRGADGQCSLDPLDSL
jgi:uncharacterized RmlC-like cupin family protein